MPNTMDEVFVTVQGYPSYVIGNQGTLKRISEECIRKNGRPTRYPERVVNGGLDTWGYRGVIFPGRKRIQIHRLVAEHFVVGKSETRNQVNHIDGNKQNNRHDNLEWVTGRENMRHATDILGHLKGEKNGVATFTNDQVAEIRSTIFVRGTLVELARRYGVARSTISNVRDGYTYKDVG